MPNPDPPLARALRLDVNGLSASSKRYVCLRVLALRPYFPRCGNRVQHHPPAFVRGTRRRNARPLPSGMFAQHRCHTRSVRTRHCRTEPGPSSLLTTPVVKSSCVTSRTGLAPTRAQTALTRPCAEELDFHGIAMRGTHGARRDPHLVGHALCHYVLLLFRRATLMLPPHKPFKNRVPVTRYAVMPDAATISAGSSPRHRSGRRHYAADMRRVRSSPSTSNVCIATRVHSTVEPDGRDELEGLQAPATVVPLRATSSTRRRA